MSILKDRPTPEANFKALLIVEPRKIAAPTSFSVAC